MILQILKTKLKKCILFLKYVFIRSKSFFIKANNNGQMVLLDMTGLRINRRIVQVALQLINSGYEPYYKMSARLYIETVFNGWDDYQQLFFEHVKCHCPKNHYSVVFCGKNNAYNNIKRIVFLDDISEFISEYNKPFFFPILFHPVYLSKKYNNQMLEFKKHNRLGILFIGSNAKTYNANKEIIHNVYNLQTRNEVICFLLDNFKEDIVRPENKEQLFSLLFDENKPLKNKIVIIDKFRINNDDYWTVLRNSAFHLWTCGYIQPYCHNQVESMSCGVIPILNKNIKYPGLDETNSIQYHTIEELANIIKKLLFADICSNSITMMNEIIFNTYNKHLSYEAFKKKLDSFIYSNEREETYYICEHIY